MRDLTGWPKYKCHKVVSVVKIANIQRDADVAREENRETDGSADILPADRGLVPFSVDHDFMRKHKPEVGGYFVVYADGYESYSPAEAFEAGLREKVSTWAADNEPPDLDGDVIDVEPEPEPANEEDARIVRIRELAGQLAREKGAAVAACILENIAEEIRNAEQ